MSYNIDTWKTKKIKNLVIPLAALKVSLGLARRGFEPDILEHIENDNINVTISFNEAPGINGVRQPGNDIIVVKSINLYGEASGTAYHYVLLPALKQSQGFMEAVLIWEGGDSITSLLVKDGLVTEREIEL
jgi:hypothetical protein